MIYSVSKGWLSQWQWASNPLKLCQVFLCCMYPIVSMFPTYSDHIFMHLLMSWFSMVIILNRRCDLLVLAVWYHRRFPKRKLLDTSVSFVGNTSYRDLKRAALIHGGTNHWESFFRKLFGPSFDSLNPTSLSLHLPTRLCLQPLINIQSLKLLRALSVNGCTDISFSLQSFPRNFVQTVSPISYIRFGPF